jgi:DNA-directed RNA polymerase specialized sigma24 family protein
MPDTPDPDRRRRLDESVRKLPRLQREIYLAHSRDGLSYEEISGRTGLTVRQLERHIAKAMYKLMKQMEGRKLTLWERWF